jgi:dipeptidase D
MLITELEPAAVWRYFDRICQIPHPSGYEAMLRRELELLAEDAGLVHRSDAAGNLRIDRPAAPGYENRPRLILQAHLDMVPQTDGASAIDLRCDPVRPLTDGRTIRADHTTLGADNGIGLAAALALLTDAGWRGGPLALLATTEEETGLTGALNVDPAFLDGDILLNLDSEQEGELFLGCAGGAQVAGQIPLETEPVPPAAVGRTLVVRGMKGGHSGLDIDATRGNALKIALDILVAHPECRIAAIDGGTLDNVIPRRCDCRIALPETGVAALTAELADRTCRFKRQLDVMPDFALELEAAELPARVWSDRSRAAILTALAGIPSGVIRRDPRLGSVESSSNLAVLASGDRELQLKVMPRSSDNAERDAIVRAVGGMITAAGGRFVLGNAYPGWTPKPDSNPVRSAQKIHAALFGRDPALKVIHAGLECGIFLEKNPKLAILSFGPTIRNPHSPSELVEAESVGRFYAFLRELARNIEL